jgi:uracil-DNA glycosylase family 4
MSEVVCLSCPLRGKRRVEPEGELDAEIVIVGEAPGEEEEKQGRPFVGYSGKVLRGVLDVLGVNGSRMYITNVVKCRPPNNQLTKEMVKCCKMKLEQELMRLRKKKLIVAFGLTAKEFFGIPGSMSDVRGNIVDTKYGKVLVTWHPAYRMMFHKDGVLGISPYEQFVKDLVRGYIYVESGRMYKSVDFKVVEGGQLESVLSDVAGKAVSLDFETVGSDIWSGDFRVLTVGLAVEGGGCYVVDLEELGVERAGLFMKELFDRVKKVVVYNAGFDVALGVKSYGWELYGRIDGIEDVQVMCYLLSGKAVPSVSLKRLVLDYLDIGQYGIDWKKVNVKDVPKDRLYEYNAIDAYATLKLYELFKEMLKAAPLQWSRVFGEVPQGLYDVYEKVVKKVLGLCIELQVNGMYVGVDYLVKLKGELERRKIEFLKEVSGVNLNSPKQVIEWLRRVGVEVSSTRKEVLEEVLKIQKGRLSKEAEERIGKLLEYRVIEKMLGTYVEPFLEEWIRADGCIHSKFSLVTTDTGRLSSSEPNLMNVPTRLGPILEKAFVSRFGEEGRIVKADFSQHELRVACQYSKDRKMKEFFESGVDIHTKVAIELYGMPEDAPEEVRKEYRRKAKGFNFGVIYGRGWKSVAEELRISEKEAKETIEKYFQMFQGLRVWLDNVRKFVEKIGYVRSMFGRFRWIDVAGDAEGWKQKAVNTPIQSAASDIAALTAWKIVERLRREGFRSKVVNFVHDSVIIDCPGDEIEDVCRILKEEVEGIELPEEKFVDFEMDIAVGKSWGECEGG